MAELIVVHGAPGSGKTTHSLRFKNEYGGPIPIEHISIGDRLRAIRCGDVSSSFTSKIMSQSEKLSKSEPLVHEVVNGIVLEFINQCPASAVVMIDGYPRFINQVEMFINSIKDGGHNLLGCINLSVSESVSVARLTDRGQRKGETDVTEDFARWRYCEYGTHTMATIAKLTDIVTVKPINAELEMEDVWSIFYRTLSELIKIN